MLRSKPARFIALLAAPPALAFAMVACGDDGGGTSPTATLEVTNTPYYAATADFPPTVEGQPETYIENTPIPTPPVQGTVTASGLEIYELQAGTGAVAAPGSIAYINYTLWLKGGHQVDRNRLAPLRFRLVEGQTIPGLIEGISGMAVGGKRIVVIPPSLGFGDAGQGNVVPPNATLIYQLELVDLRQPAG
jgi:hypothetical protein